MPRNINHIMFSNNRIPSPEEMLQIIQEQKKFIDNLKSENIKLHEQIREMKNDRCVAHIMGFAEKNAEEILQKAQWEAEEIQETSIRKAQNTLDTVDGYVQKILETEDSLEGMLRFLKKFRQNMLEIDENGMELGFRDALRAESAASYIKTGA